MSVRCKYVRFVRRQISFGDGLSLVEDRVKLGVRNTVADELKRSAVSQTCSDLSELSERVAYGAGTNAHTRNAKGAQTLDRRR